jgi:glucuronate isomerase
MKIAGLSRIFPSVYSGMAWWFFDSVSGMLEFLRTIPDSGAGFTKIGPFVTDARNIYSLKPRTQLFRRCLSVFMAELIGQRGNRIDEGIDLAVEYCTLHTLKFVANHHKK